MDERAMMIEQYFMYAHIRGKLLKGDYKSMRSQRETPSSSSLKGGKVVPASSPMALLIQTCKTIGDSLEEADCKLKNTHGALLDHTPPSRRAIRKRLDKQSRAQRSLHPGMMRLWHPPVGCEDAFCCNVTCPTHIRYQQLLSAAAGTYYLGGVSNTRRDTHLITSLLQQRQKNLAAAALALASSSASNLPYLHICNWLLSNNQYCGQSFLSSQDLFTHLETHAMSNNGPQDAPLSNEFGYHQLPRPKATVGLLPKFYN